MLKEPVIELRDKIADWLVENLTASAYWNLKKVGKEDELRTSSCTLMNTVWLELNIVIEYLEAKIIESSKAIPFVQKYSKLFEDISAKRLSVDEVDAFSWDWERDWLMKTIPFQGRIFIACNDELN